MPTTTTLALLPYSSTFDAVFVCGHFPVALLRTGVPKAEQIFNALPRKRGLEKQIFVQINAVKRCLEITVYSAQPIDPANQLRLAQFFSKTLSCFGGISPYVTNRRLLKQA